MFFSWTLLCVHCSVPKNKLFGPIWLFSVTGLIYGLLSGWNLIIFTFIFIGDLLLVIRLTISQLFWYTYYKTFWTSRTLNENSMLYKCTLERKLKPTCYGIGQLRRPRIASALIRLTRFSVNLNCLHRKFSHIDLYSLKFVWAYLNDFVCLVEWKNSS